MEREHACTCWPGRTRVYGRGDERQIFSEYGGAESLPEEVVSLGRFKAVSEEEEEGAPVPRSPTPCCLGSLALFQRR